MEGSMIDAKMAPYGALLLRVSMGILFLLHGVYLKAFAFGMTGTAKFFAGLGLAEWFAWLVMLYETIGGLALIFGVYARWVALFLGIDRKSTRLNSSHGYISYAVFCLKKKICARSADPGPASANLGVCDAAASTGRGGVGLGGWSIGSAQSIVRSPLLRRPWRRVPRAR